MNKKTLRMLILTSVIVLLPTVIGLILWNKLPEQVPIHWNIAGEVDDYSGRAMAVFGMPAFILAVHLFCTLATRLDPKSKDMGSKTMTLVLWICPVISVMIGSMVYAAALGYAFSMELVMPLVMGALFVVIGNYAPKFSQSYTVGIRLPWTLDDPENWNKTHRLAGGVWVAGGIVIMATAFLRVVWIMFVILLGMVIVPTVYSYILYRRKNAKTEE